MIFHLIFNNLQLHWDFGILEFVCSYPSVKKNTFFEHVSNHFLEQTGTLFLDFSKGVKNIFLQKSIFTLKYQMSKKLWIFWKTVFSARLGGVCYSQKKPKSHLPVWFWNTKMRITAVCTIWNILGQKNMKIKKTTFFSQRGRRLFSKTQRQIIYALKG